MQSPSVGMRPMLLRFPGLLQCEGFLREFVTPIVKAVVSEPDQHVSLASASTGLQERRGLDLLHSALTKKKKNKKKKTKKKNSKKTRRKEEEEAEKSSVTKFRHLLFLRSFL